MIEPLIVTLIVLATAAYIVRRIYRSLTGRGGGCACGTRQCELRDTCSTTPNRPLDIAPRETEKPETKDHRSVINNH